MEPSLGCTKADLDTPALCVDLEPLEANIQSIARALKEKQIDWRPHSKCHKSPVLGRMLLDAGAVGLTCAKLGEAEVLAEGGIRDLLIANMIVGARKVERLTALRKIADPIVCVDHLDQAAPISAAMTAAGLKLRMLIEVDIGLSRVGVAPGEPTLTLARELVRLPGIELAGIMGYEGHLLTIADPAEKKRQIEAALRTLVETADELRRNDLPCTIVSCGGTGSYLYSVNVPGVTELQAGGAIFMDEFYRKQCQVDHLQHALSLLVTVVSRPAPTRAIMDAGRKSVHADHEAARVIGRDDLRVTRLSAEHGELEVDPAGPGLQIGDRLELIPGYSDMTTVLHDNFYVFRGGRLEAIWPLVGRGKIR